MRYKSVIRKYEDLLSALETSNKVLKRVYSVDFCNCEELLFYEMYTYLIRWH